MQALAQNSLAALNAALRKGECRLRIKLARDAYGREKAGELAEISLNGPQCDALNKCYKGVLLAIHSEKEQRRCPEKKRFIEQVHPQ